MDHSHAQPTKFIVKRIKINKLPYSTEKGNSWDFFNEPDIFLAISKKGNYLFISETKKNFNISDLPVVIASQMHKKLYIENDYTVQIFDKDLGLLRKDYIYRSKVMETFYFSAKDYISTKPKIIELTNSAEASISVYVRWKKR